MIPEYKEKDGFQYTAECLTGVSDGLIIPFSLSVGLASAGCTSSTVLTVGALALAVGGAAMGASRFFGYLNAPGHDHSETGDTTMREEAVSRLGLNPQTARLMQQEQEDDNRKWKEMVQVHEAGMAAEQPSDRFKASLVMLLAYLAGGILPLLPYYRFSEPVKAAVWSAGLVLPLLLLFGWLKMRWTGQQGAGGVLKSLIHGLLTALAAWAVASVV